MSDSGKVSAVRRPWQFGMRTVLSVTTGAGLFCAALAGAFGPVQPLLIGAAVLVVVSFTTLAIFLLLHFLTAVVVFAPIRVCLLAVRSLLYRSSGRGKEG